MAHHEALMHTYDLLEQDYKLVNKALDDLQELKRQRHASLPGSILRALEGIIGRKWPDTLHDTVYTLLLKSDSPLWTLGDPIIAELGTMNAAVNSLQGQLYQNIKGYYTRNLVDTYLKAPSKETHPIRYIIHLLGIYNIERRGTYAPLKLILEFLELLRDIIEWFDVLDEEIKPRRHHESPDRSLRYLQNFCGQHTEFESLLKDTINPFLSEMNVYDNNFREILAKVNHHFYRGVEAYQQIYKAEQLERIRRFLLDVAQFLREIPYDDEIKTNLCQNIAFSIETTCGLYDPLESLFEKATPIMIRSMDVHKREPSPNMFEAKRARR